ncbi:MAG: hypothetical protein GXP27_10305 [Planctomycetes bacterium]|nr:hypothetical protein [Planctomycetota bacterium]
MGESGDLTESVLIALRREPAVLEAVRELAGDELRAQQRLRKEFPAELVRAACLLHELRQRAHAKFTRADRMWFDRLGLEQATSEPVARHKARRFGLSSEPVWDLCCGVGGDTIGLAVETEVVAVDRSPLRCRMTQWNAEAYEVADRVHVLQGDAVVLLPPGVFVHLDPDRRAEAGSAGRSLLGEPRRRAVSLDQYHPGPTFWRELMRQTRGGAIKIGPAANFFGRFRNAEIELISLNRECKEATVWFGELSGPMPMRATVLPAGASLAGDPDQAECRVGQPGDFLYDPDPALVRSGLVDVLAEQLDLRRLDASEEYLTADRPIDSPFLRRFVLREIVPNNDRAIRQAFRRFACHEIEIKSRHIPINADAIRRRLPRDGGARGVLIFARVAGKTRALICERDDG